MAESMVGGLDACKRFYTSSVPDDIRPITVNGKHYMPRITYFEAGKPLWVYQDDELGHILLTKKQMYEANIPQPRTTKKNKRARGNQKNAGCEEDLAQKKYSEIVMKLSMLSSFKTYESEHALSPRQQRNWDEVKRFYAEYYSSIVLATDPRLMNTVSTQLSRLGEELQVPVPSDLKQLKDVQDWLDDVRDKLGEINNMLVSNAMKKRKLVPADPSQWAKIIKEYRSAHEALVKRTADKCVITAVLHGVYTNVKDCLDDTLSLPEWTKLKRACNLQEPTDAREAVKVFYDTVDALYEKAHGDPEEEFPAYITMNAFIGTRSRSDRYADEFDLMTRHTPPTACLRPTRGVRRTNACTSVAIF